MYLSIIGHELLLLFVGLRFFQVSWDQGSGWGIQLLCKKQVSGAPETLGATPTGQTVRTASQKRLDCTPTYVEYSAYQPLLIWTKDDMEISNTTGMYFFIFKHVKGRSLLRGAIVNRTQYCQ